MRIVHPKSPPKHVIDRLLSRFNLPTPPYWDTSSHHDGTVCKWYGYTFDAFESDRSRERKLVVVTYLSNGVGGSYEVEVLRLQEQSVIEDEQPGDNEKVARVEVIDPGGSAERIDAVWAAICKSPENGREGVPALLTDNGPVPLFYTRMNNPEYADSSYEMFVDLCRRLSEEAGIPLRIVKFSTREELQEITPGGAS